MAAQTTDGIIEKTESATDERYGVAPGERTVVQLLRLGIVNLDKPAGPSSHQATNWARDIVAAKKAGHSGTLDPKVTGVLPVAFDDATKVVASLLSAGKSYVGVMHVHADVSKGDVERVFSLLRGRLYQRPPLKSAVKRELRIRRVYGFQADEKVDRHVLFHVDCEAGTYVRKLCHDAGLLLGCRAQMTELRRTAVGPFCETGIVSLHDLKDAYVAFKESGDEGPLRNVVSPVERAVSHLPKIWVKDSAVDAVCHGAPLTAPGVVRLTESVEAAGEVAIMSLKGELVAVGTSQKAASDIQSTKSGTIAALERVVMAPGTYPKKWKSKGG